MISLCARIHFILASSIRNLTQIHTRNLLFSQVKLPPRGVCAQLKTEDDIFRHGGGMFPGDLDEHRVRTRRPVLVVVHVLYLNDYPKEKEQHST